MQKLMLQSKMVNFIRQHQMATDQDKILVGVSGGIDSMVLLNLLARAGYNVGVAHCNFSLRGEESDTDEQFVRHHCLMSGIPFHSITFDTKQFAKENKLSIQVAARKLRYEYFEELCREHKYTRIAIAHNLNDSVETLLLNLTRGTGLKGLTGIKPVNDKIIRPLLFATRTQIEAFAKQHEISYRDDSSNATVKYKRNFIRHKVMPLLRELNPAADVTIYQTANRLLMAQGLVENQLNQIRQNLVKEEDDRITIDIAKLISQPAANLFLTDFLMKYSFSPASAAEVYQLTGCSAGSRVESETHVVYRDRNSLILLPKLQFINHEVEVNADVTFIDFPVKLKFEIIDVNQAKPLEKSHLVANIDFDKLRFPLTVRLWKPGDRFIPFGMKGFKKVSDFLIDAKVPLADKKRVFVLTSANEIIWVIGQRIDNRFRVDEKTRNIFRMVVA